MAGAWSTEPLRPTDRGGLVCHHGHNFDSARQGYVSLVGGGTTVKGDSPAMVRARRDFLASGAFQPIAQAVVEAASAPAGRLADLGGGTGYYAAHLMDARPGWRGVLIDVSPAAARVAAQAHPRLAVATADLWQVVPLVSDSVDLVTVVFAPRHPAEIERVLRPGGFCLVVAPGSDHLIELRADWPMIGVDAAKPARLADQFAGWKLADHRVIEYRQRLSGADIANVIAMGPSAFHLSLGALDDIRNTAQPTTVTVSVGLHLFQPPGRQDHPTRAERG